MPEARRRLLSEARLGLIFGSLSLLVSITAFWLPFYYQYLRQRHDVRLSVLGYGYEATPGVLSVSAALVNRGTGDEILLDWQVIAGETPSPNQYKLMAPGGAAGSNLLLNPYGLSQFVVHQGEAVVKRLEWRVPRDKLPGRPDPDPKRGRKTHVGLRVLFLDEQSQPAEKIFYFGAVTEVDLPDGLVGGGTAQGTLTARINPTAVALMGDCK